MNPIIVFDLDGTLIDSAPDLHAAAARLLARHGHDALSFETIRSFIGNGVPTLIDRVIAASELDPADRARLIEMFLADYQARASELTRPYPGVAAVLGQLVSAGFTLGVCTNKPLAPALAILADLGLDGRFSGVVGGDSSAGHKPDPAGLHQLHADLGGGPIIYVGDSEVDAETAVRAGIPFVLFTEGYRKQAVSELRHAAQFSDFRQLPAIVNTLIVEPA